MTTVSSHADRIRAEALRQAATFRLDERTQRCAALFEALAARASLLELATLAPEQNLPSWSFVAAVQYVALREKPAGFGRCLEDGQEASAFTDPSFPDTLESFCRAHEAELRTLIAERTCQMNAVHRAGSALLPALCAIERVAPGGEYALVEVGSSAGLLLVFDRLRFEYSNGRKIGPDDSAVVLSIDVEGDRFPGCEPPPVVRERHGLDRAPVDLRDPASVAWVRASTGFGFGLFDAITSSLADEIEVRRADALEALPASVAEMPLERRVVVFDSVSVCYMSDEQRRRLDATLSAISRHRPVLWLSLDPLLPLAAPATSVQDIDLSPDRRAPFTERFQMLVGLVAYRDGRRGDVALARSHPWGLGVEWWADDDSVAAAIGPTYGGARP